MIWCDKTFGPEPIETIENMDFSGQCFERCEFKNQHWKNLHWKQSQFLHCRFENCLFENMHIHQCEWRGSCFERCFLMKGSLMQCLLDGTRFMKTQLSETLWRGVNMKDPFWQDTHFLQSVWERVGIAGKGPWALLDAPSQMVCCRIEGYDFDAMTLPQHTHWIDGAWLQCQFKNISAFPHLFEAQTVHHTRFEEVVFRKMQWRGTQFGACEFIQCQFPESSREEVNFGASLFK